MSEGKAWTRCDCGKRGYHSVEAARAMSDYIKNRFRIYRCDVNKAFLHLTNADRQIKNPRLRYRSKFKRTNDLHKIAKLERI